MMFDILPQISHTEAVFDHFAPSCPNGHAEGSHDPQKKFNVVLSLINESFTYGQIDPVDHSCSHSDNRD
jgi:hypothetical protein